MTNNKLYKINSCAIVKCLPDWKWDTGGHSDYDLWIVLGGEATLTVAGSVYEAKRGKFFLFPPNTSISGRHNPLRPLVVAYVHFEFLDGQKRELTQRVSSDAQFMEKLLTRLVCSNNLCKPLEAEIWLQAALTELFDLPSGDNEAGVSNAKVRCVNEICSAINENVASVPSLADIARDYGYSAAYLSKVFRETAGVSFSQYVTNARINKAKTLLRSTDLPISEIAFVLGYYDSCHFIKQFSSAVGCNPGKYRRLP